MEVSEQDLELLEAYLDGALVADQTLQLRQRLATEPPLVASLDQLRSQRALRQHLWQQMTADEAAVQKVVARLHGSMASAGRLRTRSWLQYVSAAAACILIGFTVGRLGRAPLPGGVAVTPTNPNGVEFVTEPATAGYEVVVRDQATGQILAHRRFQTSDEARRFIEEMSRLRDSQQP